LYQWQDKKKWLIYNLTRSGISNLCQYYLIDLFIVFNSTYFSYIMATSFSGGRSRSTRRREPPTMGKQLVYKLDHLRLWVECTLFVIYKAGREPMPYWWKYVNNVWTRGSYWQTIIWLVWWKFSIVLYS